MSELDRRKSPLRRQLNEGFCAPDGSWSPSKTLAIAGQIVLLYHLGRDFTDLIKSWEALLLVSGFVIAPDLVKKLLTLKYGGSEK